MNIKVFDKSVPCFILFPAFYLQFVYIQIKEGFNHCTLPYINQDWLAKYKESLKSFLMTAGVRVSPPLEPQKKEGEIEILINPAMAFGSGSHETTRMVAEKIMKYGAGRKNFLDIGCGSGILTILAYLYGIKNCTEEVKFQYFILIVNEV